MDDVLVRPAEEDDLTAILDIYNERILNSTATFDIKPQTLAEKWRWLRETKHPHCVLVAERAGEVVGWACLRPFRAKAAYRYTAESSVYVRKDVWGQQLGSALMSQLTAAGKANGFRSIIAGVALPNPASVRLHERIGFRLVGVEREVGYKFECWVDVAWMQKMLGD
jgi:phosphinothricin acetyltransferase